MYKIFIDSTEFKAHPSRLSKAFGQLKQLSIFNYVEIHLSRINVDEVESAILETIKSQQSATSDAVSKASSFISSSERADSIENHLKLNSEWFSQVSQEAINKFRLWLKETKTIIHEIHPEDGKSVMNSYFIGGPPFKQIKAREDIPDAFIWESIKRISSTSDTIFFVTSDKKFQEKIKHHFKKIKSHSSLKDLFEQNEIQLLVDDWEKFTKQAFNEGLIEMIKSELKIQKKDFEIELIKLIEENLYGNQLNLHRAELNGFVTDVRFPERPELELDYVQIINHPNLYLTFDTEVELTISLSIQSWEGSRLKNASDIANYDRVFLNDDSVTDTHFIAEEYKFYRVYGEIFIELPTLSSGSGKHDVIEAVDECDLNLTKITIEKLN